MAEKQKRARLLLIILLSGISVLTLCLLLALVDYMPGEVSLRIECVRMIAQGKIPYRDLLVLENPIMLCISFVPFKFAQLLSLETGHPVAIIFLVWEWLLALVSLLFSSLLILRRPIRRNSIQCHSFLIMVASLNLISIYEFGQREHILMLALIPYLLGRWLEYTGARLNRLEACATGFGAGIVSCLDPFFIVVPFLLELFLAAFARRRPASILSPACAVITIVAVAALLQLCANPMMSAYWAFIWPVIMSHRDVLDDRTFSYLATPDGRPIINFLIVVTVLQMAVRKSATLSGPVVALGWLGFLWYVAEADGFMFNILPLFWAACLALSLNVCLIWLDLARALKLSSIKKLAALLAVLAVMILSALRMLESGEALAANAYARLQPSYVRLTGASGANPPEAALLALSNSQPGDTILALTEDVMPFYPLFTLSDRKPGADLISAPALQETNVMLRHNYPSKEQAEKISRIYLNALKKNMQSDPAQLIFISLGGARYLETDVLDWIRANYTLVSPAHFYTDNVPPKVHTSFNYDMQLWRRRGQ